MKALKLIIVGILFFLVSSSHAQVSVSVNFGSPPLWGPVGYTDVSYYYLPDVEAYFDIRANMFIYLDGGAWIHRSYLPSRYSNYDLYGGYKVVMNDYHGNTPYIFFNKHKKQYAKGYVNKSQKTFGCKPGKGNADSKMHYKGQSDKKEYQGNEKSKGYRKKGSKGKNK